jgi:hypothetical protein
MSKREEFDREVNFDFDPNEILDEQSESGDVKFDFLKEEGVEVVYLPRTPEISTTQIKGDLNTNK